MAKKRLNKKVALIGSIAFVLLAVAAIVVILYLSRDPDKFIKDGDEALKLARTATDVETKTKEYGRAERNYHKARSLAKTDSLKIEMLFKLVDLYLETDKWNNVLGCWEQISRTDTKNIKARYGRLKYYYILADGGALRGWQEVASQASQLMDAADADTLSEPAQQWESFAPERKADIDSLGPYLLMLRGRATLEMTKAGAVTDAYESLAAAIEDLQKVQETVPDNPQPYLFLAQAVKTKGQILASRGSLEEKQNSAVEAEKLLAQAVEAANDDVRAHINLLTMKLENMFEAAAGKEQIQSLESDYLSLVNTFASNARAFSALAGFYHIDPNNLDKAVEAIEKAVELDTDNVDYAITAASLYYRRFSIYGRREDYDKAVQISQNTLTLPDAQDRSGPWQWANRRNRILLHIFLANCYLEQVLDEATAPSQSQQYLASAEDVVHEIEQLYGSGEEPQVIKWQGMLELAKGNEKIAVKKLYSTYEQLQASGHVDAQLSYTLANLFKNTSEVGAVAQFLGSALRGRISQTKPQTYLDYAEVLLKLSAWTPAISGINVFEENYGADRRSRTLRIRALIGANQLDEAEEKLSTDLAPDDPNTLKLKLELIVARARQIQRAIAQKQTQDSNSVADPVTEEWKLQQPAAVPAVEEGAIDAMTDELTALGRQRIVLVPKLLQADPNSVAVTAVVAVCNDYIAEGKTGQAKNLINQFLRHFPDNMTILFYNKMLLEPDPADVSPARRSQLEKQIRLNITDPVTRAVSLGIFYQRNKELDKAVEEFRKALGPHLFADANTAAVPQQRPSPVTKFGMHRQLAVSHLFEAALETGDFELAEKIVALARRKDLDSCEGCFFSARLHMFRNQLKEALAKLNECMSQRPVFSHGLMLRSDINSMLGNEHACLEDAQKAASLNPLDSNIAKGLAFTLYRRDQKLGDNASSAQIIETRNTLINAIRLNPFEWRLQSLYAEYISDENPEEALAVRQQLQKNTPGAENAFLLADMAMRMARKEMNRHRKKALFEIAAASFEQTLDYEPTNEIVLDRYAEYYRLTGQRQKAEQLLRDSDDKKLLWNHYFQAGQFEKARELFDQLYQSDPNDTSILKGLLLVAESTGDSEAAKKYFDRLLTLEDTMENRLFQIQSFLKLGLVKEAEHRLAGFREKYPNEHRALLLEAWLAMRQGRLNDALELTNRNLQNNQDSPMSWQLRGEINCLMANYDQAIADLKTSKALSDDPLTRLALAKAYLRNGAGEDAITELKSTIDQPQAPEESRKMLEDIYWRFDKKAELALFYNETLEKFPDNPLWYNRAAKFAMAVGKFDTAERLYSQAWQIAVGKKLNRQQYLLTANTALDGYLQALLAGNKLNKLFEQAGKYVDSVFAPTALLSMAEAKMKLGDKQSAATYCRKAVDKAGTNETLVYSILQKMHSLLGAEETARYCEQRLAANPASVAANFTMFNLAKINGRYNRAVDYIDKCLRATDANSVSKLNFAVAKAQVLQLAYDKTADNNYLKTVITEYESLLSKMPNNTGILNNLAYTLAEGNIRPAEALSYAKRAHEAQPNDPGLLDTYAFVLYRNGRTSEAAEFIQAALQQYEQNAISAPAEVYEHLGMIKEQLGSADEAVAAYKQALQAASEPLPEKIAERIEKAVQRLSK